MKTLGTFTSSEDSRGAIATAPTSPIVYLAGLTAAFVILNICATLLDTADSGPTLLDAANSGAISAQDFIIIFYASRHSYIYM